ncbi:hypothetical protein IU450_36205 [Nocardia abscessus]|uniref:hypothetical protein n=1 Tax=Nocardia abscessus TaxID=120957 RepID=UPI001895B24C|nr:hypothetical protein [Nocardia abscessus]MBF6341286.1 hypothetical protein [Nocardia abscessus]
MAAALSATYAPGDHTITVRPPVAGIAAIHVDVHRSPFRFVIDVAAADAVRIAELLAELTAPEPGPVGHDWVQLGREGFYAGLEHPSPMLHKKVAPFLTDPGADPDLVAEIITQYRQGWDAASEDSARAGLPYSYTAPNQPPPPRRPVYVVWDLDLDQVAAILLDQAATVQRLYDALTADGRRRRVHAAWVDQQRPATDEEAAPLLRQLTAAGYRPHVLAAMPK